MRESKKQNYFLKVALLGSNVGKTRFRNRFIGPVEPEDHLLNVGADFASVDKMIDGKTITWQIWDLAGQDTFKSIRARFFRGAMGGLFLYDINKKESFMQVTKWIEELWRNCGRGIIPINMVGLGAENRNDDSLPLDRAHAFAEALTNKIRSNGKVFTVNHYEASIKTGLNIEEVFTDLGKQIIRGLDSGEISIK